MRLLRLLIRWARAFISLAADLIGMGVDLKGWGIAAISFLVVGGFAFKEGYVLLAAVGAPAGAILWLFFYQFVRWRDIRAEGVRPSMALSQFVEADLVERRNETYAKLSWLSARLYIVVRQAAHRNRALVRGQQTSAPDNLDQQRDELLEKQEWAEVEYGAANTALMANFYGKLFNGELIAHGFVLPHAHGAPAIDIPHLEWDFLTFDDDSFETASGNGISYRVISVRRS